MHISTCKSRIFLSQKREEKEVLGRLESASKTDLFDGHLRIAQQFDGLIDPDLVQVINRREVEVLGKQFAQITFSHVGIRGNVTSRDIHLVIQTDV